MKRQSGCPRSLQVATFYDPSRDPACVVRLPPQSPSRYIHRALERLPVLRPVAPAVSKSLHSPSLASRSSMTSGCPRSLQVATFTRERLHLGDVVRLPPQSPSRYIRVVGRRHDR